MAPANWSRGAGGEEEEKELKRKSLMFDLLLLCHGLLNTLSPLAQAATSPNDFNLFLSSSL